MTVAALWSVLDRAGCGTPTGVRDFMGSTAPRSLAVDLSIWICEALTSTALTTFHSNPAVHLVYHRTLKLLKLGVKLIFVVEGSERRVRGGQTNTRRSGAPFWRACRSCEEVLSLMGVPVVRATAEGEALCALLNRQGIVDGVISNDGDCFLFGADLVFTAFSVENLERNQVMRYDSSSIRGVVEEDEEEGGGGLVSGQPSPPHETLARDDLIAFACIAGSDLVGDGLPHVGAKKAIRFIRACRRSHPLHREGYRGRPALAVLKSWDIDAQLHDEDSSNNPKERCCTMCLHPGDKRSHAKQGCKECGTDPGEPCYAVTADEKFKMTLRSKALSMPLPFSFRRIAAAYHAPNNGAIPKTITDESLDASSKLPMKCPRYHDALRSSLIVKGHSTEASREYLAQTLHKLAARLDILEKAECKLPENRYNTSRPPGPASQRPTPVKIVKRAIHHGEPCYEICWAMTGVEFSTCEWQSIIDAKYSLLVEQFQRDERRAIQGAAKEHRRKLFVGNGRGAKGNRSNFTKRRSYQDAPAKKTGKGAGKRDRSFAAHSEGQGRRLHSANAPKKGGDDVAALIRFVPNEASGKRPCRCDSDDDASSISSDYSDCDFEPNASGVRSSRAFGSPGTVLQEEDVPLVADDAAFPSLTSLRGEVITCDMGFQIPVTPVVRRRY